MRGDAARGSELNAARAQHAVRQRSITTRLAAYRSVEAGMEAAEARDARESAAAAATADASPIARPRQSLFEGFSIPGLRGKKATKLAAPAQQTRADREPPIMVSFQQSTAAPPRSERRPAAPASGPRAQPRLAEAEVEAEVGAEARTPTLDLSPNPNPNANPNPNPTRNPHPNHPNPNPTQVPSPNPNPNPNPNPDPNPSLSPNPNPKRPSPTPNQVRGGGGEHADADVDAAERRVAWIQHHLRLGLGLA